MTHRTPASLQTWSSAAASRPNFCTHQSLISQWQTLRRATTTATPTADEKEGSRRRFRSMPLFEVKPPRAQRVLNPVLAVKSTPKHETITRQRQTNIPTSRKTDSVSNGPNMTKPTHQEGDVKKGERYLHGLERDGSKTRTCDNFLEYECRL